MKVILNTRVKMLALAFTFLSLANVHGEMQGGTTYRQGGTINTDTCADAATFLEEYAQEECSSEYSSCDINMQSCSVGLIQFTTYSDPNSLLEEVWALNESDGESGNPNSCTVSGDGSSYSCTNN